VLPNNENQHRRYKDEKTAPRTANQIRASCDRRLSRAAREIVKQKLLQAVRLFDKDDPTKAKRMITTTTSSTAEKMGDWSTSGSGHTHPALAWQDILSSDNPAAQFSVWKLLESVSANHSNNGTKDDSTSSSCPLDAQRDVFRRDEEHISIIKADLQGYRNVDTPTANRRHVNSQHDWYQCTLCGKIFSSRFYLDRHLEAHHPLVVETAELLPKEGGNSSNSHHNDDGSFWICPATDWCGIFLSMSACHEMALVLEPHYGPGSSSPGQRRGQHGVVVHGVERRLWREAHERPCTTSGMQAATTSCRNTIQSCFPQQPSENDNDENSSELDSSNVNTAALLLATRQRWRIGQVLDKSLCSTLSCPDRLHRLFFQTKTGGDLVMRHVHEWQDEWIYWNEDHHEVGWIGVILLLSLAVWYANALLQYLPLRVLPRATLPSYFRRDGNNRKVPKAQGSRLLRKSPTKTSTNTLARGKKTKEN
jgi:hypothetical protein